MALRHGEDDDAQMQQAVEEIKSIILEAFPDVTFELGPGYDPDGVYLDAILDTEDFDSFVDDVNDLVRTTVMAFWGRGIDLFVIPGLTPERNVERNRLIRAEAWPN